MALTPPRDILPVMHPPLDVIRDAFPALETGFVFLENAGGSQVPRCVIEAMSQFMVESYVQTGAGYAHSERATAVQVEARRFAGRLMGVAEGDHVVMGASSTLLLNRLGASLAGALDIKQGDETVVSLSNHESNIGPWVRWEARGASTLWWGCDAETGKPEIKDLLRLLGPNTRVVSIAWTSNLLGDIQPVGEVVRAVRERAPNALVVVDAVAYAPHRPIRFEETGADALVFSMYKVFGPHQAYLVVRKDLAERLAGENHFFLPQGLPYAFELGCQSYEACAGTVALGEYFASVFGGTEAAFESFAHYEAPLQAQLLDFLASKPNVRLIGPRTADPEHRVPTISFVHATKSSREIASRVQESNIGIRHGHMYACRLCEHLGISTEDGVVRISAVHYNSPDEIERLIGVLDPLLEE